MTRLWTVMSSIPLAAASASPSFTPVLTFGRREEDSRMENQDLNFTDVSKTAQFCIDLW